MCAHDGVTNKTGKQIGIFIPPLINRQAAAPSKHGSSMQQRVEEKLRLSAGNLWAARRPKPHQGRSDQPEPETFGTDQDRKQTV